MQANNFHDIQFTTSNIGEVYTILDFNEKSLNVVVIYISHAYGGSKPRANWVEYERSVVQQYFQDGTWKIHTEE